MDTEGYRSDILLIEIVKSFYSRRDYQAVIHSSLFGNTASVSVTLAFKFEGVIGKVKNCN